MVLGHYKSHLGAYTKAVSIKEGKTVFSLLQRKRDREGKLVVAEITVDKDIDEYTCNDCLILWKKFLVLKLGISEGSIQFHDARPGNSTTLCFTVPHTFAERAEMKLTQPDVVWTMKELGILRVRVVGVFNVDLRKVLLAVIMLQSRTIRPKLITHLQLGPPAQLESKRRVKVSVHS